MAQLKLEVKTKKQNRHVVIALAHMGKRRTALLAKNAEIEAEISELDNAIVALGAKDAD